MMADLTLKGVLNLVGNLKLNPDGGKVLIGASGAKALVVEAEGQAAPPVLIPPPPASPSDPGTKVKVISSFNNTVTANGKTLVALGVVLQGNVPSWPGMMLPSVGNPLPSVTINHIAINVANDQATIFPSGGVGTFTTSGQ
jgi:hypothetical protein